MTDRFDLSRAPMRIGRVDLKIRDLGLVAGFYRRVLGLHLLAEDGDAVTLGTAATPLLRLTGDPALPPRDPREAGLFHTAFLLPDRADLGRWLGFAIRHRIAVTGASDHLVSEAIYLDDPEGNGIEIYADRPPSRWRGADGAIRMATEPLDGRGLLAATAGEWDGFPEGGRIGHVHLQVGDTVVAERFYGGVLGLELTGRYPGASFFGSGGYHHQLAGNTWNSRGAGVRGEGAGLGAVEIVPRDEPTRAAILARAAAEGIAATDGTLADPWGTRIVLG